MEIRPTRQPEQKSEKEQMLANLDYFVGEIKRCRDNQELENLKQRLMVEFPEERIVVEILFDFKDVLEIERKMWEYRRFHRYNIPQSELKNKFLELTEWQFTATYFIFNLGKNPEYTDYARKFWLALEELNEFFSPRFDYWKKLQAGIVGQTAVCRLSESYGGSMANPDEDAYEKIDFWLPDAAEGQERALQIKCREGVGDLLLVEADAISYPSVAMGNESGQTHFSNADLLSVGHLRESCQSKAQREGRKIRALYVVLPRGRINLETGEPDEVLRKQFEEALKK